MSAVLSWPQIVGALMRLAQGRSQEAAHAVAAMLKACGGEPRGFDAPGRSGKLTIVRDDDWASALHTPADYAVVALQNAKFLLLSRHQETGQWHMRDGLGVEAGVLPEQAHAPRNFAGWVGLLYLPQERYASEISEQSRALGSVIQVLNYLWRKYRHRAIELLGSTILINLSALFMALFSLIVYDKVIGNDIYDTLWVLAAGLALYGLLDFSLRQLRSRIIEHVSSSAEQRFDQQLLDQIVSLKTGESASAAVMLSRYRDLAAAREGLSSTYLVALADIPFVLLFFVVISWVAWPMGITFLVMIALFMLMQVLIKGGQKRLGEEASRTVGQKMEVLQDLLGCRDVLRSGLRLPSLRQRWDTLSRRGIDLTVRYRQASNTSMNATVYFYALNMIVTLSVGVYLIDARVFTSGSLVASSMLASRAIAMAASMVMVLLKFSDLRDAVRQFAQVVGDGQERRSGERTPTGEGTIRLINVTKAYDRPVLNSVSLTLAAGEKAAFLGRPGSGKSTLLSLVAGVCAPSSGMITIDHCPVSDIPCSQRCRWITYKPQEAVLFNGSIEDNILAGGTTRHLQEALFVSGLEEDMASGALSLATPVGDRGCCLSGGQRQKVALARAVAVGAPILILDEPTAWLDHDTEQLLIPRWRDWMAQRTVLLVTHSPLLLDLMDRIVIIDQGRIVADKPRREVQISNSTT
jgi:ABC-type bacteriocin/lantibiotic exporter with double-glycine peptidase domain